MIFDAIQEWFQELLIDGIISNLTGMFDTLNTKVGEIAGEVGMTPSAWNSGIFNMVRSLSETVIVPIAGIVLTFVMCYPYVWGGSSPETSFDCSGFVSYVLTNTGLCNTGRLGAQGLYNISTPVSDPQPGDLVFFVGTYDTSGISHVGIYVGDNMMLHCGDPISYTNLNTSYWQSHFYAYGRPPYN